MQEIKLRLNNFLWNSGVLGFYRILENADKPYHYQRNELIFQKEILQNFAEDYINSMLKEFEQTTKWYAMMQKKTEVENYNLQEEEGKQKFEQFFKNLKTAVESASYKSGYEILRKEQIEENPYKDLEKAKKEKDLEEKRKLSLAILQHLKEHKEVYCMKDIIYTKINVFWENVAFLNASSNQENIKKCYESKFVKPAINFLEKETKSNYQCIECGKTIKKSEAMGMSWLKDVGVDIKKKNSGYWNFQEDVFLCPICSLIYSCVPLGFTMVGPNGIFVNDNDSMEMLILQNDSTKGEIQSFNSIYQTIFNRLLNQINEQSVSTMQRYEPKNIQVIKRITVERGKQKYEFNQISKEKLEIFQQTKRDFEELLNIRLNEKNVYEEVLSNFLENRKQYALLHTTLHEAINGNIDIHYVKYIINIQLNCIKGGNKMELDQYVKDLIEAGENLQKYFYINEENKNKLKTFSINLNNALRSNSVEKFMEILTNFYLSVEMPIPKGEAFTYLMTKPESFRLLGNSYVFGLQKRIQSKGGKENEK